MIGLAWYVWAFILAFVGVPLFLSALHVYGKFLAWIMKKLVGWR